MARSNDGRPAFDLEGNTFVLTVPQIIALLPDYDPTAYEIGLTKGELKALSKVVGLPAFYGTRKISGITVYLEQRKSGQSQSMPGYTYYGGSWQQ